MNKLFKEFKSLFKELGPNEDLINMYLVFIGVRSACLIEDMHIFYAIPKKANLEIYFGRYPGYAQKNFDYPLVCLKNSLVSRSIQNHNEEFTEFEVGLYLGYECFNQDWSNTKINRYGIIYNLGETPFYNEVCSMQPNLGMLSRIKFRAKAMTAALKLIDPKYSVRYSIEYIPKIELKKIKRSID